MDRIIGAAEPLCCVVCVSLSAVGRYLKRTTKIKREKKETTTTKKKEERYWSGFRAASRRPFRPKITGPRPATAAQKKKKLKRRRRRSRRKKKGKRKRNWTREALN